MGAWERGQWLNPPAASRSEGSALAVTAVQGSDFWQRTSYGFERDTGHALLRHCVRDRAVEVSFVADFGGVFEQAGVLVRIDAQTWVKAGVEVSDGVLQVSAVATREGWSDWSTAPVEEWSGQEVTVRASLSTDALTVRARAGAEPWRLVRLAPWPGTDDVVAGPYCCSPQTGGLVVRFTGWREDAADAALHA